MADRANQEVQEGAETAQESEGVVSARDRFQRLSEDVQSKYRDLSGEVRRGAERATSEIRRGAEKARDSYNDVTANARVGYEKVRRETGKASRELSTFVRENPAKAVAIAAGAGFLLGLLVRRDRDDEI